MKFTTIHTATGLLSHVEGTASLLGFLPQEMLWRNIMDFYHPEDMALLKEIYEKLVVEGQSVDSPFFGKPYRFLAHNGCYVTIETEWSAFINPGSRHLELVIGHHQVLKGPSDPDVLAAAESKTEFPESLLNESKIIRDEILKLLHENAASTLDDAKEMSQPSEGFAGFMKFIMDKVSKPSDLKFEPPQEFDSALSRDNFDSESSSENLPSYHQLNYDENIQRFFNSRPVTIVDGLDITKTEQTDTENAMVESLSHMQCSDEFESASCPAWESAINIANVNSNENDAKSTLTEALLSKHNEEMEKMVIKRYKLARVNKDDNKIPEYYSRGVKRSNSHLWESEAHKAMKHQHILECKKISIAPLQIQTSSQNNLNENVDLRPPFSMSSTPIQNTHTTAQASIFPAVFYVPQNISQDHLQSMHYGVFYQPMVYPHSSSFYQMSYHSGQLNRKEAMDSAVSQIDMENTLEGVPTPTVSESQNQSTIFNRPPSQATSVKAAMGSTSPSEVNKVSKNFYMMIESDGGWLGQLP